LALFFVEDVQEFALIADQQEDGIMAGGWHYGS
jgi:hypothetical protein